MGVVEYGDPIGINSSIALLQERFKQLHREKRRREEKELLRLFSSKEATSIGATHSTKRRRLFCSEALLTDTLPLMSLSLWPNSTINCQTELMDAEEPVVAKKMREERLALQDSSFRFGHFESDVDTSLHLTASAVASATQSAVLAKFGQDNLQWMKICEMYGKFCNQISEGVACALLVSFIFVVLASISAFSLFRLYGCASKNRYAW